MPTTVQDIKTLQKEMALLRSFLIGFAGKDREGSYRPEFVARIFAAMNDQSLHRFRGAENFLKQLHA